MLAHWYHCGDGSYLFSLGLAQERFPDSRTSRRQVRYNLQSIFPNGASLGAKTPISTQILQSNGDRDHIRHAANGWTRIRDLDYGGYHAQARFPVAHSITGKIRNRGTKGNPPRDGG